MTLFSTTTRVLLQSISRQSSPVGSRRSICGYQSVAFARQLFSHGSAEETRRSGDFLLFGEHRSDSLDRQFYLKIDKTFPCWFLSVIILSITLKILKISSTICIVLIEIIAQMPHREHISLRPKIRSRFSGRRRGAHSGRLLVSARTVLAFASPLIQSLGSPGKLLSGLSSLLLGWNRCGRRERCTPPPLRQAVPGDNSISAMQMLGQLKINLKGRGGHKEGGFRASGIP